MTIKTLLLSGLSMALLAAPAFAQGGKTGERLINDDRVPEAPQLKKPIFNKPNILTQEEIDKAPEPPSTDVHQDVHGKSDMSEGEAEAQTDAEAEGNVNLDVNVNTQRSNFDADEVADDIEDLQEELEDADIQTNTRLRVNGRGERTYDDNGYNDPDTID